MRALLAAMGLAACGDGLAASPDASVDSAPPETRGIVSIEYRGDIDVNDVVVWFQTADSTLVLATHPDANGQASCLMDAGGFVTLAFPDQQLLTYTDAPVDETLRFEHFTKFDPAATAVTVKVPADPAATTYRLYSSCGAREIIGAQLQPLSISLDVCDATADILVSAVTPTRERFAFRDEALLSAPIIIETPYQPEIEGTIIVNGSPPSAVLASQTLIRGTADLLPRRMTAIAPGAGMAYLTMPRPAAATQLTHLEATTSDLHVIEWEPAALTTIAYWPDTPLRSYTTPPAVHEERPIVIWEESTDGALADGVYVELGWNDSNLVRHTWYVLAPRTATTSLQLPVLPYADLVPSALTTDIVRFDNFSMEGGFAAAREAFRLGRFLPRATWFVEGERGRVIYQALD